MAVIHGVEHNINQRYIKIQLQEGPIKENGVNGCQIDDVLAVVVETIQGFNTAFPCRENSLAITHLQEAQHWLEHRKRDREARGVEGTSQK